MINAVFNAIITRRFRGDSATVAVNLLLESGDMFLLENGNYLLLESAVVVALMFDSISNSQYIPLIF